MKALPSISWHHSNQNKYSPAPPVSSCGQGISALAAVSVMCCICKNVLEWRCFSQQKRGCLEFSRMKLLRMIGVRFISRDSILYFAKSLTRRSYNIYRRRRAEGDLLGARNKFGPSSRPPDKSVKHEKWRASPK
jgi:hypothetical protein